MHILYRGHKHEDYLKTKFKSLCFWEDREKAKAYGLGLNDSSNVSAADGYVTIVEFHGAIISVSENGLASVDKHIHKYSKYDAVRFKDGVVVVLNFAKLQNPKRVKASE